MVLTERVDGQTTILVLSGGLNHENAILLKDRVATLLAVGKTHVHLTCSDIEFINSAGLGGLVSILKAVRMAKGRLTLSNLSAYALSILDLTQLTHIFDIYPTEKAALQSYPQLG